jgi:hypothetical protein
MKRQTRRSSRNTKKPAKRRRRPRLAEVENRTIFSQRFHTTKTHSWVVKPKPWLSRPRWSMTFWGEEKRWLQLPLAACKELK